MADKRTGPDAVERPSGERAKSVSSLNRAVSGGQEFDAGLVLLDSDTLLLWAHDPANPARRYVVELFGDGESLGLFKAESFVPDLYDRDRGDGCYGHYLALESDHRIALFELSLSNTERVLCSLGMARDADHTAAASISFGTVLWRGGLRLSGELTNHRLDAKGLPILQAFEGSRQLLIETRFLPGTDKGDTSIQFDLHLPSSLADGQAHEIRVIGGDGAELTGSPLSVFAHQGGYRALMGTHAPARFKRSIQATTLAMLDRLIPGSVGFEQYPAWSDAFGRLEHEPAIAQVRGTLAIILIGRAASEATLATLKEQSGLVSLKVAILDAVPATLQFTAGKYQEVCKSLAVHQPDAWMVLRSGASLRPFACSAMLYAFSAERNTGDAHQPKFCLADYALFDADGKMSPLFFPVFDEERLLSQGYGEGIYGFRHPPALPTNGSDENFSSYDVLLSAMREVRSDVRSVVHIPAIAAQVPSLPTPTAATLLAQAAARHLVAQNMPGQVVVKTSQLLPLLSVKRLRPSGTIGLIIPTRDRLDLLKPCLESIRAKTLDVDYRILVVDNGSVEPETLAYLEDCRRSGIAVCRDDKPFNYARLNNEAVAVLDTPFIGFINNDIEVISPDWLSVMQSFFARNDVGGVGAKLIWPNGMLQHGGVVIGLNYAAGHAYDRYLASESGYGEGIATARECSALTAACLLVKRADFLAVGGFDERAFPVAFNDVDLCLKLRAAGKVLIWTPEAELLHHESASRRGDWELASKRARADKELAELRTRWGRELRDDPYYNPNLNLDAYPYTGLALPPRYGSVPRQRHS